MNPTAREAIERQPPTIETSRSVAEAIALMHDHKNSYLLVVRSADPSPLATEAGVVNLVGIVTERDVVRLAAEGNCLQDQPIEQVMTRRLVTLQESQLDFLDVFGALNILREYHIRHLPIVDHRDQLVGIVTASSIRRALQPHDLLRVRQVREAMSLNVIHAFPDASALKLAKLMVANRVGCVVICQEWQPSQSLMLVPIGIVTERDVVEWQTRQLDLAALRAVDVMRAPLVPIYGEDSLWLAHELMHEHQVRRLVVTSEAGELLGILTQTSLLQVIDPLEMAQVIRQLQQMLGDRDRALQQNQQELAQVVTIQTQTHDRLQCLEAALEWVQEAVLVVAIDGLESPSAAAQALEAKTIQVEQLCVVYVNRAFTRLTGYDLLALVDRSLTVLRSPLTNTETLGNVWRSLQASAQPIALKLPYHDRSGQKRTTWVQMQCLRNDRGHSTHCLIIQRLQEPAPRMVAPPAQARQAVP